MPHLRTRFTTLIPALFLLGMATERVLNIPFVKRVSFTEWAIHIVSGDSPVGPFVISGEQPVLAPRTLSGVAGLADPFMLYRDSTWTMFFEVVSAKTGQGDIGVAVSQNLEQWHYLGIVLDEPYHLSYPYVFEHEGCVYMTPESSEASCVRLYRATRFPDRWEKVADLLKGHPFVDPSLAYYSGRWWLWVSTPDNGYLFLYWSERLEGPYHFHPANPIVIADRTSARPGGRVVAWQGKLVRFAQVDEPYYGFAVRAFIVEELTETSYRERPIETLVVQPGDQVWNARGMHTVDPHPVGAGRWMAAVDGQRLAWRWVVNLRPQTPLKALIGSAF